MKSYVICNDSILGRILSYEKLIFVFGEILCMLSLCLYLAVSTYPLFTLIANNNDKFGASYLREIKHGEFLNWSALLSPNFWYPILSYRLKSLHRSLGLQEVEGSRISRQLAWCPIF